MAGTSAAGRGQGAAHDSSTVTLEPAIYVVLNIFTHSVEGPFSTPEEGFQFIREQADPCGLAVLPMGTKRYKSAVERACDEAGPGRKILAIKAVRGSTTPMMPLKEAKDAVDAEWIKRGW